MTAVWIVPVAIALGAIASQLLFSVLHKPDAVLGQPVTVVTSWGWSGAAAWALYFVTILFAGIGYWRTIARAQYISLTAIVGASALACCAAFGFRFIFSSDIYAYAAYGALAATHQNPYFYHTFPPVQLIDAHWTHAIGFEWPSLPACVYSPAFVLLASTIVTATHFNLATTLVVVRVMAIVAFVASVALGARIVPERGRLLAAIVGLNPVIISTVADGHYDAVVLLVIAIAAAAAARKPALGGLIAGASTLLKATGGLASLALGYAMGSARFTMSAVVAIICTAAIQLLVTHLAGGIQIMAPTDFVGTGTAAISMGIRGLIALALAMRALHNAGKGDRAAALAAAALTIWAIYPQDYPWYGVWLLPLAAFTLERREGAVLLVLTFSSTLRYLSDAYGFAPAAPWLELIALVIPLAAFLREPLPT